FDLSLETALENGLSNDLGTIEFWGELIPRRLYKGVSLSQGMTYEDQGNKFKLYFQSKKNVMVLEQLYSYRIRDRKSTRLNSSHVSISYAVFCLKKKIHNSHILSIDYF